MAGDSIRRRTDAETERELAVDRSAGKGPGGAEGGEASRSKDLILDYPGQEEPFGDTDQHSNKENLPPVREGESQQEGEGEPRQERDA